MKQITVRRCITVSDYEFVTLHVPDDFDLEVEKESEAGFDPFENMSSRGFHYVSEDSECIDIIDADEWELACSAEPVSECHDCGKLGIIHPDSETQRGEPICVTCAAQGAFAP